MSAERQTQTFEAIPDGVSYSGRRTLLTGTKEEEYAFRDENGENSGPRLYYYPESGRILAEFSSSNIDPLAFLKNASQYMMSLGEPYTGSLEVIPKFRLSTIKGLVTESIESESLDGPEIDEDRITMGEFQCNGTRFSLVCESQEREFRFSAPISRTDASRQRQFSIATSHVLPNLAKFIENNSDRKFDTGKFDAVYAMIGQNMHPNGAIA